MKPTKPVASNETHESTRLRSSLRDFVTLSALPGNWVGRSMEDAAEDLADALLRTLALRALYVRVPAGNAAEGFEIVRPDGKAAGIAPDEARSMADQALAGAGAAMAGATDPGGGSTIRLYATRFGAHGSAALVAAAERAQFPTEEERLLLGMAANQLDVALQGRREDETRRMLLAQAQLLAAIVESSGDAIVAKTLHGVITYWNPTAEKVFGYSSAEIVGKSITMLIPPELLHEEEMILSKLRRGEGIAHYETVRVRKDGTRLNISLTVSPIRDLEGNVVGASKIARDITERKRIEAEREEALDRERAARTEAERVSRLRDDFLATVSHELRTPLNGILGWTQLLRRKPQDNSTHREALEAIERGARAQARIIDDLLDVSRVISGKLRLDVQTVELLPLVESAIDTVRPAADAKEIRIERVLDPAAGPIKGDPARLQQILWNLLSNAVKFTPKGGKVQVHLERVNSHLEISVTDTGRGISPEFLPHVFDRFSQADSSITRRHGGLGLGLAVVKHLVELHGGRVWARSPGEGLGASFHVQMPVLAVQHDSIGRMHPAAPSGVRDGICGDVSLEGVHVLVVDDDPDACAVLRRVLIECHAEVDVATSAREALQKLQNMEASVIVSDIGMPDTDGYEFIREARSRGIRTPAVAVTAFARAEDRIRAIQAGYNMHVAKPLEPQELIAVIAALCGRESARP